MEVAKIFLNGRSQAVRLPKDCRFDGDEVYINKIGSAIVLMPKTEPWANFMSSLDLFSEDFMSDGRGDAVPEKREDL